MASVIKVCMGSSCFARGNAKNLQAIQNYIESNGLDTEVELCGLRCCDECSKGPNVNIDGVEYNNVETETLYDILEKHYKKANAGENK